MTAHAAPSETPQKPLSSEERAAFLRRGATLQSTDASTELVTIVAQVVADRATQAGWAILRDRLAADLGCGRATTRFPNVCNTLSVRMQDLVASPRPLLDAAMRDLLTIVRETLKGSGVTLTSAGPEAKAPSSATSFDTFVAALVDEWRNHANAAVHASSRALRGALVDIGKGTVCPNGEGANARAAQAIWAVANCVVKAQGRTPDIREQCDLDAELATCTPPSNAQARREAGEALEALLAKSDREAAKYAVEAFFDMARDRVQEIEKDGAKQAVTLDLLRDSEAALTGAIDADWTKVSVSASLVLADVDRLTGGSIGGKQFFVLAAAVGQYAATYADPSTKSVEEAQKTRRDVIESLVRSMVSRSDRRGGAVFSLGGTFGLGAAYRRSFDGSTNGGFGPFVMPLGVAVQTYPDDPKSAHGWTAQLSALDIGQYIAWESGKAEVGSPELRNAVSIGLSVGYWFASREVPIWIGPYGGISPFVRKDGNPSAFIGGTLGAYVPLLDF